MENCRRPHGQGFDLVRATLVRLVGQSSSTRLLMIHSIVAMVNAKAVSEAEFPATALQRIAAVRANEQRCLPCTRSARFCGG